MIQEMPQALNNDASNSFKIIARGKLPNSSYYDVSTESSIEPRSENLNTERINTESNETDSQNQTNNLEVWSCVFSPDQNYLAWSCGYGLVKIMNLSQDSKCSDNKDKLINKLKKKVEIIEINCDNPVWSLAFGSTKSVLKHAQNSCRPQVYRRFNFNEDKLILAIGLSNGKIRIYDGQNGRFLFCLFDHSDLVRDLKFTKDGTLQLASVSRDETIKLWNMYDDGNMYKTLKGHLGLVYACDWSPTAQLLCSVGSNRQAFVWNLENYTILHQLKGHLHDVVTCEFSPDGAVLATGSFDTKICLWDPYTGLLIRQFCHLLPPPSFIYAGGYNGAYIRSLNFSASGDHLVSICDDKKIRIWSLCSKSINPVCEANHKDGVSCAYSSNAKIIMVGTRNGHLDFYEANTNVPRLVSLCRKIVNQYTDRKSINELCLPIELKKFLKYDDLKEATNTTSPKASLNIMLNQNSNQFKPTIAF